jgi:tetratricopeptide (TPR) repeat protein
MHVRKWPSEPRPYQIWASMALCLSLSVNCAQASPSSKALAYYRQGSALNARNKCGNAITYLTLAIQADPEYGEAYWQRGHAQRLLENLDAAMKDLEKAIALQPGMAAAYAEKAYTYGSLGKTDLAIETMGKAIDIQHGHCWFWIEDRANWYEIRGDLQKALRDSNQAIRENPTGLWAHYGRAGIYYKLGRYQEAVADLNTATKLQSNAESIKVYQLRAQCYDKIGKHDLAEKDRQHANTYVNKEWSDFR